RNDAAIAEYRTGITNFPNDARFYIACAETLLASPDSPKFQAEAENLLKNAVRLKPQSAEGHYQLGQLALQQRRFQDAENEFSLSLQSDPNQSKVHFALSDLYRRMGRDDDAKAQFATYEQLKKIEEGGVTSAITAGEKP